MTSRDFIEKIKADFTKSLEKNSPHYRRAIIRELDFLFRKYDGDFADFAEFVQKKFDIPASAKSEIIRELKQSQDQIAQLWDEYFAENMELFNILDKNDFEKMQALYNVDFSQIKTDARDIIMEEIKRTARAGKGYEVLRSRLRQRGLGDGEARTLANTALAQFDNAMMFEFAQQGGIEKFKYDGVLHENTRPFCIEHLGKKYTIQQIRELNNGQGLPVETSCGGYNCTHWWTPVINEVKSKKSKGRDELTDQYFNGRSDVSIDDEVLNRLRVKNISRAQQRFARLAGAPDGSEVSVEFHSNKNSYKIVVINEELYNGQSERYLYSKRSGEKILFNQYLRLAKDAPKGIGTRIFATQVKEAIENGVDRIETFAAGSYGDRNWNGYYTWPRLGYDAELKSIEIAKLPKSLKDARTILDLMETQEGIEWWERNGTGRSMSFDLSNGSKSLKQHLKYLEEKGVKL